MYIYCLFKVKNVSTKEIMKDELKWVKFSNVAWTHDHKGFFYQVRERKRVLILLLYPYNQRYPEPDTKSAGTETTQVLNQKVTTPTCLYYIIRLCIIMYYVYYIYQVYYHVLGEEQSNDVLCYEFPDHPDWLRYRNLRNFLL